MEKTIAFIGTGNMGSSIIRATCGTVDPGHIVLTDALPEKAKKLAAELGCRTAADNNEAARIADCIMLCVKPQVIPSVLRDLAPLLKGSYKSGNPKILYSIAAGIKIETIRGYLETPQYPVIRIMPNTPALVGKGLMLISCDDAIVPEELNFLNMLLSGCGNIEMLDERLIDQATVSASCSPAFVYMFIEAMADGGVSIGLSRTQAQRFAANAVYGAAAMVMETGMHPGALKDMVCSPGGSTIAGVAELEDNGFRRAVINAVSTAYKRNLEMGKAT